MCSPTVSCVSWGRPVWWQRYPSFSWASILPGRQAEWTEAEFPMEPQHKLGLTGWPDVGHMPIPELIPEALERNMLTAQPDASTTLIGETEAHSLLSHMETWWGRNDTPKESHGAVTRVGGWTVVRNKQHPSTFPLFLSTCLVLDTCLLNE